jgi:16S rRNA (guanine527-N7)-methyltransferase
LEARRRGFLGPGPAANQLWRSLAFAAMPPGAPPPELAVDLGSGGGIPGLVLALHWPESRWALLESNHRRADWLASAALALGVSARAQVVNERAELVGRGSLRYQADLVTARGFAGPAATAECGAPLLHPGGRLLVADPPAGTGRWSREGLALLGLRLEASETIGTPAGPTSITSILVEELCPERYPRRVGVPAKRPLF